MIEKLNGLPKAFAGIQGSDQYPEIQGIVYFFEAYDGTIVMAEIYGLPDKETHGEGKFFAFHIHEDGDCAGTMEDPFAGAGMHYNPEHTGHPGHAGDLPLLLSADGMAWSAVYTGRFHPDDVVGKSVIVHSKPDDYRTQPSGDSGEKIACGEIQKWTSSRP